MVRTQQKTVGTAALQLLEQNDSRLGCVVTNAGAVTVFVGQASDVVAGNGHALLAGNTLSLVSSTELYGAVASGTALVTVLEEVLR